MFVVQLTEKRRQSLRRAAPFLQLSNSAFFEINIPAGRIFLD